MEHDNELGCLLESLAECLVAHLACHVSTSPGRQLSR